MKKIFAIWLLAMCFLTTAPIVSFWADIALLWGAEGVISKGPVSGSNYCHLRFPAIREDTLFSSRPQLKDPKDGDMVDFYGPCDYDPLGIEQVRRQRVDVRRDRRNDNDSD